MTVFVYLICWTQSGGLAKYGMTEDAQNRKDWERWARSQYREELRSWGKWGRAYSVPMRTAREAKDWEFLMGKIVNLSDLKRMHPWREIDKESGQWCISGDETVNCFNQALQQFEDQKILLP